MLAAMDEAEERGIPVIYGDVPMEETFRKISQTFTMANVLSLIANPPDFSGTENLQRLFAGARNSEEMSDRLKHRDAIREATKVFRRAAPAITKAMLTDRDERLFSALVDECPGAVVVGIVGLAHLDGIEGHFKRTYPELNLSLEDHLVD